jgi:hypothetical protein
MTAPAPRPEAALDYLRSLRSRAAAPAADMAASAPPPASAPAAPRGFEALEDRLAASRTAPPARKARGEDWLRIPVTPDVELHVRGRLDAEARARLERCADLVRDILLGRDR